MAAETKLSTLLASMSPELSPREYVFCTRPGVYGDFAELSPLATFAEAEGLTLVLEKKEAIAHELPFDSVFRLITLRVHSSLDAVGLTAAVATKLTEAGISANVIAAYYHDHIFVQAEKAELAMASLEALSAASRA